MRRVWHHQQVALPTLPGVIPGRQPDQGSNGPGPLPAGMPNLPDGFSENLAEQLSKMPSGLSFPPKPPGPQGNIPAAFRGGGKRKKK